MKWLAGRNRNSMNVTVEWAADWTERGGKTLGANEGLAHKLERGMRWL